MLEIKEPEDYGLLTIEMKENPFTKIQTYTYKYRMIDGSERLRTVCPKVYEVNFRPHMEALDRWFEEENEKIKKKMQSWAEKQKARRNKRFLKGSLNRIRKT